MSAQTRARLLRALRAYRAEHGVSPTVRELGRLAGVSSTSEVNRHLHELAALGVLRRAGPSGAARCWVPTDE
ncbi:MAG: LexA family protein [Phycisphaerae bacterium]